jgi:uncharacterized protein (TIGR02996 family)
VSWTIAITSGTARRRKLMPVSRTIVKIGKLASNDCWIDGERVSRIHAVMERTGDVWVLIDLGSADGTIVNGKKVNKATISDGDVVDTGGVTLRFDRLEGPPVYASPESVARRAGILAHPADDGERLVYADWLVERGDPIGELIQAQLGGPDPSVVARAAELAARWEAFVVGDPEAKLLEWQVRGGFLDVIRVTDVVLRADELQTFARRHPLSRILCPELSGGERARLAGELRLPIG